MVIENQGALTTTLYTTTHYQRGPWPTAYVSPKSPRDYRFGLWPGGTVVSGTSLQVLMMELKFRPGVFSFRALRDYVATFSLPQLTLLSLARLPPSSIEWSQGVLTDGGFTYIYGTSNAQAGMAYAARVAGTDLTGQWSYYDGNGGWTANPANAGPMAGNVEFAHMSVSRVTTNLGPMYALITMSPFPGNEVVGSFSCSPVGPFGPQQPLYTPPEPSMYPPDIGVITYGAHAHPELSSTPNSLVVSYDVNPIGPKGISNSDPSIYRPRFIDVTFQ
jgi:hypothetical protein